MKVFLKILSALGIVAWCVCFAFGFNYSQGGALSMSLLMLVFMLAVFGLLLYLMSRWSNPRTTDNRANSHLREMVCLALYVVATLFTVGYVAQFITVQSTVKNELQPLAQAQIDELQRVFDNENTPGSYLNYIKEQVVPTYTNHLRGQYSDDNTVQMAVARLQDELTGDGKFEVMQEEADDFLSHARYAVENWVPWTICRYLTALDENCVTWEQQVIDMSHAHEWTASEGYMVRSVATGELLANVTTPKDGNFSFLAIILIIAMQLLMLLSYVSGRAWNVSGPKKAKGTYATWNGGAPSQPTFNPSQNNNDAGANDNPGRRVM